MAYPQYTPRPDQQTSTWDGLVCDGIEVLAMAIYYLTRVVTFPFALLGLLARHVRKART